METTRARAALESEKVRLEKELGALGRPTNVPGDWELAPSELAPEADMLDQAEITTAREDDAAVLADLEARHASVCEALRRIERGTYGLCEACGTPIEEKRLAADPAATTCVAHR